MRRWRPGELHNARYGRACLPYDEMLRVQDHFWSNIWGHTTLRCDRCRAGLCRGSRDAPSLTSSCGRVRSRSKEASGGASATPFDGTRGRERSSRPLHPTRTS